MNGVGYNPLVDGYGANPNPLSMPNPFNNAGATQGAVMGTAPGSNMAAATLPAVGTAPLTGAHNTPLHVAFLGLLALLIIIGLKKAGFRFSFAGKVGK